MRAYWTHSSLLMIPMPSVRPFQIWFFVSSRSYSSTRPGNSLMNALAFSKNISGASLASPPTRTKLGVRR